MRDFVERLSWKSGEEMPKGLEDVTGFACSGDNVSENMDGSSKVMQPDFVQDQVNKDIVSWYCNVPYMTLLYSLCDGQHMHQLCK